MTLCGAIVAGQHVMRLPQQNQEQTVPRRLDTGSGKPRYIENAATVGGAQFGAGESATVGNTLSQPANPTILFPAGNNRPVNALEIGSSVSKNILINNYNADGRATGFLRIAAASPAHYNAGAINVDENGFFDKTSTPPYAAPANRPKGIQQGQYDPNTRIISPYLIHFSHHNDSLYQLAGPMWSKVDLTVSQSPSYKDYIAHLYLSNHVPKKLYHWGVKASEKGGKPYTTTAGMQPSPNDTIDNGVHLIQSVGDPGIYPTANIGNAGTPAEAYRRPTTVAVGGRDNVVDHVVFRDLEWYLKAHNLETFPANSGKWYTDTIYDVQADLVENCGHVGKLDIMLHQIGSWIIDTVAGANRLDAAVQLLDDARLYVRDSIADQTRIPGAPFGTGAGTITSAGTNSISTDAILALPATERFTLRVEGNVSGINMKHCPGAANLFFTEQSGGGGVDFPDPDVNIYLYRGADSHDFKTAYAFPPMITPGKFPVDPPFAATDAAIFGVNGDYHFTGNNAEIHTVATGALLTAFTPGVDGADNNPGVIEIGADSDGAKTGYRHFHIYSGGMLKNFEYDGSGRANFGLSLTTDGNTPEFVIDGLQPLYIVNAGNNDAAGSHDAFIRFDGQAAGGIRKVEEALADGGKNFSDGALHIQARGPVVFGDHFNPDIRHHSNELRILSSQGAIRFAKDLYYTNAMDSDLLIVAQGGASGGRSCYADTAAAGAGAVAFDGAVGIMQLGRGATVIRSVYDDVFIRDNFAYASAYGAESGEVIVQAGQDLYGANEGGGKEIIVEQQGGQAILLEAKHTIRIRQSLLFDCADDAAGNIILKAGYDSFADSASVRLCDGGGDLWRRKGTPAPHDYGLREACADAGNGGDIWLEGNATVSLTETDTIHTVLRAKNSIYIDSGFVYAQEGAGGSGRAFLFAEQGNVEALLAPAGSKISFAVNGAGNTTAICLQAGNRTGEEGSVDDPTIQNPARPAAGMSGAEYDGNILLDKTFEVRHNGLGHTLLSSSRDIENQVHAPMRFVYSNPALTDSVVVSAGRHLEAHAAWLFDFSDAGGTVGDPLYGGVAGEGAYQILLQAGRLDDREFAAAGLTKTREAATALTEPDGSPRIMRGSNDFSKGGVGHGSIFIYDSAVFNYPGNGAVILRALNGNIESDPYLHRRDARVANATAKGYDGIAGLHNAPVVFNHSGGGVVRLEATDIKLHDMIVYGGGHADASDNGRWSVFAYDSILTRNVEYRNPSDSGSVHIVTAKVKNDAYGNPIPDLYDPSTGGGGIHQGHIVLGYGAGNPQGQPGDRIVFDFSGNRSVEGANVFIRAGYDGFVNHPVTGRGNSGALFAGRPDDAGKGYGGNIAFAQLRAYMADGNHSKGGYLEISSPNGNIWGMDSLCLSAFNGDLRVDAGLGSLDDTLRAAGRFLNTSVPFACNDGGDRPAAERRTGNIMMKGVSLNFRDGAGNAFFRTREGFIDIYDAFTASDMRGALAVYAGADDDRKSRRNPWGCIAARDFLYTPSAGGGSVFFGADNNIMLNYGNSNGTYPACDKKYPGGFDAAAVNYLLPNPFYFTGYEGAVDGLYAATFDVNRDGFLFYRNPAYVPAGKRHRLYRGCDGGDCDGAAAGCRTAPNSARPLTFDFSAGASGGLAAVASNYIDFFTAFDYRGGQGDGLHAVPERGNLHGETVKGYGLYIKSQYDGEGVNLPEKRRASCEACGGVSAFPVDGASSVAMPEMTCVTFHDDARIRAHGQQALVEAPVVEFFGNALFDAHTRRGARTEIALRGDSLIFHDSVVFGGGAIRLAPFTVDDARRMNDMRYGVVNDRGNSRVFYKSCGEAIRMDDRHVPVLELGYGRCAEPAGREHPDVLKNIVVAMKHGYVLPVFNTVVADNARISFLGDLFDDASGGEYTDAFVRADLLRIRNRVAFYTDSSRSPVVRFGNFLMDASALADDRTVGPGIYTRHLHLEPGGELSLSGGDELVVNTATVAGGYGMIRETVVVEASGVLAPGLASLMEGDCMTPRRQGKLTVRDLEMKKDAALRISVGNRNCATVDGERVFCTQTDTLSVLEEIFFTEGKVPLYVMPETEALDPGCYLFLTYGDSTGVSAEYVRNFDLKTLRHGEYYFTLNFSVPGAVYLCVTTFPVQEIRRYVDLPAVEGVTTVPEARRHYVAGHKNFEFTATYAGAPLKVRATGFYSGRTLDLDATARPVDDRTFLYTIYQVVEPWTVAIGPDLSPLAGDAVPEQSPRVWAHGNVLHIQSPADDEATIYSPTGLLQRRLTLSAGITRTTLPPGLYIVVLRNIPAQKIIISGE
jgi:hypothetical protein